MDDLKKINVDASSQYLIFPTCPFNIYCVSKLPGEAVKLGWEASTVLIAMSPIIKRDFKFSSFDVQNFGKVGKIDEYKDFWTVPISLMTAFWECWEISQVAPRLQDTLVNAYSIVHSELEKSYQEPSDGYSDGGYSK